MIELHLPWLELSILIPLVSALIIGQLKQVEAARKVALLCCSLTLFCSVGAWQDFGSLHTHQAHDRWDLVTALSGQNLLLIDELSAPLLPLVSLLFLLTVMTTLSTKLRRFSFAWTAFSQSILLAILSCREPHVLIALLGLSVLPVYRELRVRNKPTGVFLFHMGLSFILMIAGWALVEMEGDVPVHSWWAVGLLTAAVLIRSGVAPVHCWMSDLFEHATFGTALLFITPMTGAYAAIHLVLPIAPPGILKAISLLSLMTAVYAAGMAIVQREARRMFCYLLLSHSSLVLVGLETATPVSLTGALCVWLSVGLALGGLGLTLRSLEARTGRLLLTEYHGMYEQTPSLAGLFLLTGLASVGFPGTFGFIGTELLVDGAVSAAPVIGGAVVLAVALNGIAIVRAYFALFTGTRRPITISMRARGSERWAVLTLALLILGGGIYPQPGIHSRYKAAQEIVASRREVVAEESAKQSHDHEPETPRKISLNE